MGHYTYGLNAGLLGLASCEENHIPMVLQVLDLLCAEMFCLEDPTETPRRNHNIWQRSTEEQLTGVGEAYEPFVKQMINVGASSAGAALSKKMST